MFNGGNVGVNTISPSYTLDVNGTAAATTFTGSNAQLSGTISANTLVGSTMSAASMIAGSMTSSTIRLNNGSLYLKNGTDAYHGLNYDGTADGPRLYGWAGGALGNNAGNSMTWTLSGISTANVYASNSVTTGVINLTNSANGINFAGNFSNKQIALAIPGTDYYGMGASNSAMQYQAGGGAVHRFYNNSSIGSSNAALGNLLLEIHSTGVSSSNVQLSGTISAATHVGATVSAASMYASSMTAGSFNVIGTSLLQGAVTAGALNVTGVSILQGAVTAGALNVTGESILQGNATMGSSAVINGFVTSGALNVTGVSILQTGVTAGCLYVTGASNLNTLNVTNQGTFGSLMVNTVNMTPSLGDMFKERSYSFSSNIATATIITDGTTSFAFANGTVRSFEAQVS
jgi:hypothetical protein